LPLGKQWTPQEKVATNECEIVEWGGKKKSSVIGGMQW